MKELQIEPQWLGSLYGIIAFVMSCLIFVYRNGDFLDSVLKIIATSICFYILGLVNAVIFNYISNNENKSNQNSI